MVIGLAVVPFMLFYLLKDRETAVSGIYSLMPSEARRHAVNVVAIVNRVVGAYIRAQLTLGVIVGVVVSLGLFLLGIKFSMLLGIVAGVTELIPIIGPLLGAIPGVFVTLATAPEKVLWVVLLYAGVQAVENVVLVPRIQGHAVGVNPAIIMVALMVGSEAAGLWGVFLAVPVTAVGRDIFNYFHAEWSKPPEPQGLSGAEDDESADDDSEKTPVETDKEAS
jgi:predicted PurR-regulated permease PerM